MVRRILKIRIPKTERGIARKRLFGDGRYRWKFKMRNNRAT
jgi:hypothetical protein